MRLLSKGRHAPSAPPAPDRSMVQLNLGCGHVQPEGWVNVDGSNRARVASRFPWLDRLLVAARLFSPTEFGATTVYADLSRRFPWRDNSVDAVYMGEILEHFTRERGLGVLGECYRVLRPGGVLRVRVPDNAQFWANYLAEYGKTREAPRSRWDLGHVRWTKMFFRDICVAHRPLRSYGHYHKFMYDDVSLILTLEGVGFRDVDRMPFRQSRIPDVASVEVRDDLIVEAVKPDSP